MTKGRIKKHLPHSNWTESDKRRAVTVYKSLGVMQKTSDITGIPYATLRFWQKQDWWKEYLLQERQEDDMELEVAATSIAKQAQDIVKERLENGDFVLDREGNLKRKPVSARDATLIEAIHLDKRSNLRDQPEIEQRTSTNERLLNLVEQFIKFTKAREINHIVEKEEKIVDAEFEELREGLQAGSSDGISSEETAEAGTYESPPGNDPSREGASQ